MISILTDKFDQLSSGSISEYHFICVFEELFSHELTPAELFQTGEFILYDWELDNGQVLLRSHFLLADSELVNRVTCCPSLK